MAAEQEPEFVAETLAWCNDRRAEKDMPPLDRLPKGHRQDPRTCPCGAATGLYVEHETYGDDADSRHSYDLPDAVMQFVMYFDDGDLPQYDLDAIDHQGRERIDDNDARW